MLNTHRPVTESNTNVVGSFIQWKQNPKDQVTRSVQAHVFLNRLRRNFSNPDLPFVREKCSLLWPTPPAFHKIVYLQKSTAKVGQMVDGLDSF